MQDICAAFVLNAGLLAAGLAILILGHDAPPLIPNVGTRLMAELLNVAAFPFILIAMCCMGGFEAPCSTFISCLCWGAWGSGTVAMYGVATDKFNNTVWTDGSKNDQASAVLITMVPTVAVAVALLLACCCGAVCSCGSGGSGGGTRRLHPGRKFTDRWTRRYDEI